MSAVYIAASSAEIERAERWAKALRGEGIEVTSTWMGALREVQRQRGLATGGAASNLADDTFETRRKLARENVRQVLSSSIFWLLVPPDEHPSQGAYYELATANSDNDIFTIASGGSQRFVFVTLADQLVATDEEAFDYIVSFDQQHAIVLR